MKTWLAALLLLLVLAPGALGEGAPYEIAVYDEEDGRSILVCVPKSEVSGPGPGVSS